MLFLMKCIVMACWIFLESYKIIYNFMVIAVHHHLSMVRVLARNPEVTWQCTQLVVTKMTNRGCPWRREEHRSVHAVTSL